MGLTKLSKECMANKGLCCENRMPTFFELNEAKQHFDNYSLKKDFYIGKYLAISKKNYCPFFQKPNCSIYNSRPIDCKTYPVSFEIVKNELIFVIDSKCPAVKKGLVSNRFIQESIKLWRKNMPSKGYIKEYFAKDKPGTYKTVPIEAYLNYKKSLKK